MIISNSLHRLSDFCFNKQKSTSISTSISLHFASHFINLRNILDWRPRKYQRICDFWFIFLILAFTSSSSHINKPLSMWTLFFTSTSACLSWKLGNLVTHIVRSYRITSPGPPTRENRFPKIVKISPRLKQPK